MQRLNGIVSPIPAYRRASRGVESALPGCVLLMPDAADCTADEFAPLSAALVVPCSALCNLLRRVAVFTEHFPWVVICLGVDGGVLTPSLVGALTALDGQRVVQAECEADAIAAIRRRPAPHACAVAEYIARRLRNASIAEWVARAMSPASCDGVIARLSSDAIRRRAAACGALLPRDWEALYRSIAILTELWRNGGTDDSSIWACGCDPRTLRRHVGRFTGLALSLVTRRPGWEWIVEAALRRNGYVQRPCWLELDGVPGLGRRAE